MDRHSERCDKNFNSVLGSQEKTRLFLIFVASVFCIPAQAKIDHPKEPYISYTVKAGDNLNALGRKLLISTRSWPELAKLNGLKTPHMIQPGLVLDIPLSMLNLGVQQSEPQVSMLLEVSGDVKINNQPARAGDQVATGDKLQTGANSSARVQMADGSRVQWMPKTLAEVSEQGGYLLKDPASSLSTTWFSGVLRLVEGVLEISANKSARRAKQLGVVTSTSTLGVRGTTFRVAFEDPVSLTARTEVLAGLVRSENPLQATAADVAGGYGTAFKPQDKNIKVVPLLPALPPEQLPSRVLRSRNPTIGAADSALWSVGSLVGALGYRVELARDPAFDQIVAQIKTVLPQVEVGQMHNGVYFARIRGFDAQGIEGFNAVQRIEIMDAPPLPAPPPDRAVWMHEIGIGVSLQTSDRGYSLKVNRRITDLPAALTLNIASDPRLTQNMSSVPVDAQGIAVLPMAVAGQKLYLRFVAQLASGAHQESQLFLMELPENWGKSVFAISDVLQPVSPVSQ